jgi:hypothetical protein
MGQRTDAYLYFGIDAYNSEDDLVTEWMAKHLQENEDESYDTAEIIAQAMDKLISSMPEYKSLYIGIHCSCDYPVVFVAARRPVVAHRGYPEVVKPEELVVSPEELDTLLKFLKQINCYEVPTWRLASYWG